MDSLSENECELAVVNRIDGTVDHHIRILLENGYSVDEVKRLLKKGLSLAELAETVECMATRAARTQTPEDEMHDVDLLRFHLTDARKQPTGVFDHEIFVDICEKHHIFVLGGVPYLYKNGVFRPDYSGAELKTLIRVRIFPEFVKSTTIRRVYDLFLSAAELQVTAAQLNNYPPHWICFRNAFYDPLDGQLYPHDPKYRAINQVPCFFDPLEQLTGETTEAFLRFAIPDLADREMLLQYAGLCLTKDTRQQKFLLLIGAPGSGKSTLIRLIEQMVGADNTANVSLATLGQRFASFGLMGKLLNSCADLELTALEDVSTVKRLLGEDTICAEAKGRDAVSFHSYARMIFSTNEMPLVRSERTNGFFRRLLILRMDNTPERRDVDLFDRLVEELPYFVMLSVRALERLYRNGGYFAESDNSRQAVAQMRCDSDSVEAYLTESVYRVRGGRIERGVLFDRYSRYCFENERQALTRNNFFKALRAKGFSENRDSVGRYFCDISFEKSVTETVTDEDFALLLDTPTPFDG